MSITFVKQNNRRKRVLPGEDHYVGLVFYSADVPTGMATNNIKEIADVAAAEALGITADNASVKIKTLHYHISQLFRLNKDAVLYVGVFAEPASNALHTFNEVETLRVFANNKLRKIGVFTTKAYVVGQIALLQAQYTAAYNVTAPAEILYSPNLHGTADADLPNHAALTSPNVHTFIAQDGAALGKTLYTAASFSIGVIGAALGIASLAKVNENIAWVEKFNVAVDGGEYDVPALSNGTLISSLANNITKNGGTIDTKRLIFLTKYPNYTGSYFNDSHGAVVATSDYAYMEDNLVIDKAIRGIYQKMMPNVKGPSLFDKVTKKLRPETVSFLELEAAKALEEMERAGELSGFTVSIDPEQNSYTTGIITVDISNTAVGVNRQFVINIGY
jgi:Protein of unknown function (DUF2586)